MTTKFFRVWANHSVPDYAADGARARCRQDTAAGHWSASMRRYGCSKDAATPENAIREMLADHACTNIRVELDSDQTTWPI